MVALLFQSQCAKLLSVTHQLLNYLLDETDADWLQLENNYFSELMPWNNKHHQLSIMKFL